MHDSYHHTNEYMNKLSEYIVENVDIVDVISRRVQLKRAGSNFSGLSPFQ